MLMIFLNIIFNNKNLSCILPVGSTQDRNSNADPSTRKLDWILARSSLILILGVKSQEGIIIILFG